MLGLGRVIQIHTEKNTNIIVGLKLLFKKNIQLVDM